MKNLSGGLRQSTSAESNGASAVGVVFDTTNALSTSGAKLISFKNAGVEKLAIDKDGALNGSAFLAQLHAIALSF